MLITTSKQDWRVMNRWNEAIWMNKITTSLFTSFEIVENCLNHLKFIEMKLKIKMKINEFTE